MSPIALVVIVVLLVALFGGGWYGRGNNYYGYGAPRFWGGGIVGLIVLVAVVLWLTGNLHLR